VKARFRRPRRGPRRHGARRRFISIPAGWFEQGSEKNDFARKFPLPERSALNQTPQPINPARSRGFRRTPGKGRHVPSRRPLAPPLPQAVRRRRRKANADAFPGSNVLSPKVTNMETRTRLRRTQRLPLALGAALALLGLPAPRPAWAADPPPRAPVGEYQLSGPYTHENLTIYLIHGKDRLTGATPLLLQEALKQKKVVIRETGRVNELTIENVSSDAEVFVQSGDVIKGGQQDRLLAGDLLLRPKSGKVPIACYCVESGRWEQRGAEAKEYFSSSSSQLASKGLRLAGGQFGQLGQLGGQGGGMMQLGGGLGLQLGGQIGGMQLGGFGGSQLGGGLQIGGGLQLGGGQLGQIGSSGQPFAQFGSCCQSALDAMRAAALVTAPGASCADPTHALCSVLLEAARSWPAGSRGTPAPAGQTVVWSEVAALQRKLQAAVGDDVRAKESESSLELTLEDKKVREGAEKCVRKLSAIVDDDGDATGFVFAVNGRLDGGEVYASKALFRKLWPKLLDAAAVEALAERSEEKYEPVSLDAIKACLLGAEKGEAQQKEVAERTKVLMRETDKYLFFETRDVDRKGLWIHRSYLTK
jgi:hypothetical protein